MEIKAYSKKELAQAYAPDITTGSALNRLATWIDNNPDLCHALQQSGYRKSQHVFTHYQVRLLFEFLGEP